MANNNGLNGVREACREELRRTFVETYEREPENFDDKMYVWKDLHADEPDPVFAVAWGDEYARRLSLHKKNFPALRREEDYKIGQLLDMTMEALRRPSS